MSEFHWTNMKKTSFDLLWLNYTKKYDYIRGTGLPSHHVTDAIQT